jgi:hypothetical protein
MMAGATFDGRGKVRVVAFGFQLQVTVADRQLDLIISGPAGIGLIEIPAKDLVGINGRSVQTRKQRQASKAWKIQVFHSEGPKKLNDASDSAC